MRWSSRARIRVLVAGLAAGGALLSACARPQPVAARPNAAAGPAVLTIPGQATGLVSDTVRGGLWYLVTSGATTDLTLFRTGASTTSTIRLPALPDDGSVWRKVAVAPDDSVWVASGYVLLRVDPDKRSIQRLDLSLKVHGMLPDALDRAIPLPGTWISAMTFTADSRLVIARNNVPFLQVITPGMAVAAKVALPAGMDGLSDIALGPDGLHFRPSHAHGTAPAGVYRTLSVPSLKSPARPQLELTDSAGPAAALSVVGPDRQFVTFDARNATLTWSAGGSSAARQVSLPAAAVQVAAPNGQMRTVIAHAQVDAATFDGGGHLWYVQTWDGRTQLIEA